MTPDPRPVHLRPRSLALVALGGTLGTAARAALAGSPAASATADGWPWATWTVNVTGAFGLGVLLALLVARGRRTDDGRVRDARLLLGTGVLGGYTTYSTLALDTVTLAAAGGPGWAGLYAASTLVLGVAAAAAGAALAGRSRRPERS